MNNQLQIFNNDTLGIKVRTLLNDDGSISVNAEDTAIGFGWTEVKDNKVYVMWRRINQFIKEFDSSAHVSKEDFIPESIFYLLGMKANNETAKKFQMWLAIDVIPSIRKTGSYQVNSESHSEMLLNLIPTLRDDEHKNPAVEQIMIFVNSENVPKTLLKQKTEMSENAFRDLVVEFMNENDVVIKRHKQGLVIDKDALYKYFSQYGWTQHDVLEALDKYKMIYHKGEDRTESIRLNGDTIRALVIN